MSTSVRDARGSRGDRLWLERVYRQYLDDLAPLATGLFPVLGEVGHSEPDQLARWFSDPAAIPFVIAQDGEPVGFAMVSRPQSVASQSAIDFRMSEFFIERAHRRRGIGRSAVNLLFDRLAGQWEILEYTRNPDSIEFWRRVVASYTRGEYRERISNGEVRQVFATGPRRR